MYNRLNGAAVYKLLRNPVSGACTSCIAPPSMLGDCPSCITPLGEEEGFFASIPWKWIVPSFVAGAATAGFVTWKLANRVIRSDVALKVTGLGSSRKKKRSTRRKRKRRKR